MLNISKWAVLLLSVLSLAVVGCGDDDKGNDDGVGGSAGDNGTAGTDEGTAGTDEGTAGTGGEEKTECEAMCDNVYACDFVYGDLDRDGCVAACEAETLEMDPIPCMAATTECQEIYECTFTCQDWAFLECTAEGGSCEAENAAADVCADEKGCRVEGQGLDLFCFWMECEAEGDALFDCLDTRCESYMACPDED